MNVCRIVSNRIIIHDFHQKSNSKFSDAKNTFLFLSLLYRKTPFTKNFRFLKVTAFILLRIAFCRHFLQSSVLAMQVIVKSSKFEGISKKGCFSKKMWYNSHNIHRENHPSPPPTQAVTEYIRHTRPLPPQEKLHCMRYAA